MYRVLLLLFFSTSLLASNVKNEIERVYHGHTTSIESRSILSSLESGMPYNDSLDNARVMDFKCFFLETDTAQKRQSFESFLAQAIPLITKSGSQVLLQSLSVCKASQLYSQGLYSQAKSLLIPIANTELIHEYNDTDLHSLIGLANKVLSRTYVAQGQYKLAFDAAQKSYLAYELADNYYERALSLREIAGIHLALFNYDLAIEQLQRAKSELVAFNVQEQYKVADEIAYAYEQKGDTTKAISLYLSIFDDVRKFEDDDGFAYLVIKVAELYTKLSELDKAKQYLNQAEQLIIESDWIKLLQTMAHGEWLLATDNIAAALRENEVLTQSEQRLWPFSFKQRYLWFSAALAERQGDYQKQVGLQQQLLLTIGNRTKNIADRALLSERLMFNFNQQNREIARLEEVAVIKEKLLTVAVDKAFWQRLTLVFACVLILLLAIYTYKQVQHKKHYKVLALKDELTGVANRRAILDMKQLAIINSKASGVPSSLISIDIDFFKAVNDKYGHDIGDELIKSVVNKFSQAVRSSDKIGRVGGEEFLIVLEQQSLQHALEIAERIRSSIEKQAHTTKNISATVSIGVVEVNANETPEQAAKRVDVNLYAAKKNGRNTVVA